MEKQLSKKARFDAKIPMAQKEHSERAASLGGFRTLTDFIIHGRYSSFPLLRFHQVQLLPEYGYLLLTHTFGQIIERFDTGI